MSPRLLKAKFSFAVIALLAAQAAFGLPVGEMAARAGAKRLAAGLDGNHTCFLEATGSVRCWGDNSNGQVGDGSSGNARTSPTSVSGIVNAVSVAVGRDHSCALLVNGTVKCWGSNALGQLGTGAGSASSAVPVLVSGLSNVVSIAAGSAHTCARKSDGTVSCWGQNNSGQLGDGTLQPRFAPVGALGLANAVTVAAGGGHTCAVRANGLVQCWGANDQGQLGLGDFAARSVPSEVTSVSKITSIAAGNQHTCARRADGEVLCWGSNDRGQFGDGSAANRSFFPVQANLVDSTISERQHAVELAAGHSHTCAVVAASFHLSVACWGKNSAGQLGRGQSSAFETDLRALGDRTLAIAAGLAHTCELAMDGSVKCWGDNSRRQLGIGNTDANLARVTVSGLGATSAAKMIAAGTNHSCALRANGRALCWGRNLGYALGDGTSTNRSTPTDVILPATFRSISAGGNQTCGMGELLPTCWGQNTNGQSLPFVEDAFVIARSDRMASQGLVDIEIVAGGNHGCEAGVTGRVYCRGSNNAGQLGDAAAQRLNSLVAGLSEATAVAAGSAHSCALQANGEVYCWGSNSSGQLGDGTLTSRADPRQVSALPASVVAISAGAEHTCAVTADGRVFCWGRNDAGQVDGTTAQRLTATVVPGLAAGEAVGVTAGFGHTCVLRVAGGVKCWGRNADGELGNNSTANSATPVLVVRPTLFAGTTPVRFETLSDVVGVVAGQVHNCALRTNGGVVCWGDNDFGQIGDGSTLDRRFATTISGTF